MEHKYYVSIAGVSTSGRSYTGDMTLITDGSLKEADIKQAKRIFRDANPDKGLREDTMHFLCIFELDQKEV